MRGDREVSGSGVCKGVGEAPTFTEWSMMMVPTYPEDDSRALKEKVYQHQQFSTIVVRVGHKAPVVKGRRNNYRSRLRRPIRLKPSR